MHQQTPLDEGFIIVHDDNVQSFTRPRRNKRMCKTMATDEPKRVCSLTYSLSEMGNKIHNDLYWFCMFLVSWTWLAIDYKTTYHFEDALQNQESTVMLFSSPVVIVPHVVTAIFRQRLLCERKDCKAFVIVI